jgi:hypothetical protein
MKRIPFFLAPLLCIAGAAHSQQVPAQDANAPQAAAVDQQAMDALDRMGKALRAMKQMELHADTTEEVVLDDGQKVEFGGAVEYKVKSPHGLYAKVDKDRRHREYYYDGKTLTIYAPRMKYYARLPAPDTVGGLVAKAQADYGIEMPLADLYYWGTDKAPRTAVTRAMYVGPAFLGKTPVAQYAFRQGDVDWQVWLDGEALPRKLVIVDTSIPERPEYTAALDWTKNASIADTQFEFTPGEDAYEIKFYPGGEPAGEATP